MWLAYALVFALMWVWPAGAQTTIKLPALPDTSKMACQPEAMSICSAGFVNKVYCSTNEENLMDRDVVRKYEWHGYAYAWIRIPPGEKEVEGVWLDFEGDGVTDEFYATLDAIRASGQETPCDTVDYIKSKNAEKTET